MTRQRILLLSVSLATVLTTGSEDASGQNSIGDALGRIITPAVGPVLERAADEAISEGIRRGYERGRILPLPGRRRPSPQPVPRPSPKPYPVQPTPAPVINPEPVVRPSVEPPQNQIPSRPTVSPNLSPIESVMTHVVAAGPAMAAEVIRNETAQLAREIDLAVLRYADSSMSGDSASEFRGSYRKLLSGSDSNQPRSELWNALRDRIEVADQGIQLGSLLTVADSADYIARNTDRLSHDQVMESISSLRSHLVEYRGTLLGGQQLAVLAERVKNLRNFAVVSELARVLGVQRRKDLLPQFAAAAFKSRAPDEAVTLMLGVPMGHSEDSVATMQLPEGIPAVVVFNPSPNPGNIGFVCDDQLEITLGPGELAPFGQGFVIRFDDGSGRTKRYTLDPGLYRWVIDQQRWDLRKKTKIRLSIDASQCPSTFHYLLNGEAIAIRPGEVIDHELTAPPRIDFDLGIGDGSLKSSLLTPGHYVVGVNPETSGWELYHLPGAPAQSGSPSDIAMDHLRKRILETRLNAGSNAADAKVNSLLDSIE